MSPKEYSNGTEYEIKSSENGIADILLNHYGVNMQSLCNCDERSCDPESLSEKLNLKNEDVASIVAYVLINSEQCDSEQPDSNNYLVDDYEQYKAIRAGKDHVVVFSELKNRTILDAVWFLIKYGLLTKWNPNDPKMNLKNYGPMVVELIRCLQKAVKKLNDSEKCVFARIFELHRGGKRIFGVSDIQCCSFMESTNGDAIPVQICDYQTEGCSFRSCDYCKIKPADIKSVMDSLCTNGILESIGKGSNEKWILVP